MATRTPTLRYSDILSIVSKGTPRVAEAEFSSVASNLATNLIWYAFDWRESLEELPPFYLIPGVQDYGTPFTVIPQNFHGLRKAFLGRLNYVKYPQMAVAKDLEKTHIQGIPTAISYEASLDAFRVHPIPNNLSAPTWWIEGTYKKRPSAITNSTLNTLLPFDDMYLNVWVEALRWAMYHLLGSEKAGVAVYQNGQLVSTGQLGTAMAAIEKMASTEGLEQGDVFLHPENALVSGGTGFSGNSLFGWI